RWQGDRRIQGWRADRPVATARGSQAEADQGPSRCMTSPQKRRAEEPASFATGLRIDTTTPERSQTTMLMLFSRTVMIPVWLVVFGLFVSFASPTTFPPGLIMVLVGGVAL